MKGPVKRQMKRPVKSLAPSRAPRGWTAAAFACWAFASALNFACTDQIAARPRPPLTGIDTTDTDAAPATPLDAAVDVPEESSANAIDSEPSPCAELCLRVEGAACPTQKPCLPACEAAVRSPGCGRPYLLWASCAAREPPELFLCDRRGQGALDSTRCSEELKTFGDCLLTER